MILASPAYRPPVDLWPVTFDARESLLTTFEGIEGDRWEVESLCAGWTIRDVLAHLILAAHPPATRYATAVIRAKGSFDKANHELAVDDARLPTDELVARYRAVARYRFSPPGWPDAAPLSDILLHSLDVRIPLGAAIDVPPGHYEPVLGLLFRRLGGSFTTNRRPEVRWIATDRAWTHGSGPEVQGTMENLALTAAGRRARIDRLHGDGVASLREWLA